MQYSIIKESDVEAIAKLCMDCYNNHADGCWPYTKACRRIRQMVTVKNTLCHRVLQGIR